MKRNKTNCPKCKQEFSLSNIKKHQEICNGQVKQTIKFDPSWSIGTNQYQCPYCTKIYQKKGILTHIWRYHTETGQRHDPNIGYRTGHRKVWNKGLTKNDSISIASYAEKLKGRPGHGYRHTTESKRKISEAQKKAHEEGRAWNIGMSRWNNEPSYPEKFMMRAIQNEFIDKNYIREYPVGIYAIDFAWPHKFFALEIDGDQHQRFDEYIERDKRKDKLLKDQGWAVLRIPWKDIFSDPKNKLKEIRSYIE